MDVIKELEDLKQRHYDCEDCWYSCPKSEDGCCDDRVDKEVCNCGADYINNKIDAIIEHLKSQDFYDPI